MIYFGILIHLSRQKLIMTSRLLFLFVFLIALPTPSMAQGDASPRFSPDGQKIIFYSYRHQHQSFREARNAEIYMMDADGSYEVRLTYTPHGDYSLAPSWSPDGKQIAFSSGPDMRTLNVIVMNLDSTKRRTMGPGFVYAWSADGEHLNIGGESTNLESGERMMVKDQAGQTVTGTHSPNWLKIAYIEPNGEDRDLWVYDVESGIRTQLSSGIRAVAPAWSFDSKKIVFSGYLDGGKSSEAFSVNINGSNFKQLTNFGGWVWRPSWSPDGSQIVFASDRDNKEWPYIYLMNQDGSHVMQLTGE